MLADFLAICAWVSCTWSLTYKCGLNIFLHHYPSLSCTLVRAILFSKYPFYYHITSHGCRDLDRDLDSGWIICLYTGISQGAAGWLNTAQELKCCRQSFQKEIEKKNPACSLFAALTGSAFYSVVSLHSSLAPIQVSFLTMIYLVYVDP